MRVIQVTMDERLLAKLDADQEAMARGRSAVIRQATAEYLRKKRRAAIRDAYRKGYGEEGAPELDRWIGAGSWPDE